jgi:hypothetical protein
MQDQYSLMHREEEREMFGLLADQGAGSIPYSRSRRDDSPGRGAARQHGQPTIPHPKSSAMTMVASTGVRVPKPLRSSAVTGAESGK